MTVVGKMNSVGIDSGGERTVGKRMVLEGR